MPVLISPIQWILGTLLIASSLGVILLRKPIYASLSFLATLLVLAAFYLQLEAPFMAVMQIIVYAGAILVIFMFVIVLFQDAHEQIKRFAANSSLPFLIAAGLSFLVATFYFASQLIGLGEAVTTLPKDYGTVQLIGQQLYVDFFFPFEAVILIFLIAIVGALYIGKKEKEK